MPGSMAASTTEVTGVTLAAKDGGSVSATALALGAEICGEAEEVSLDTSFVASVTLGASGVIARTRPEFAIAIGVIAADAAPAWQLSPLSSPLACDPPSAEAYELGLIERRP